MRVAGNKIKHLREFFRNELRQLYETSEIEALFQTAAQHYLTLNSSELHLKLEDNLNQSDLLKLYDCAKELKKNIPIQYVLGYCEFLGLKFKVRTGVLIPRPETEELMDLIIKENKTATSFLDIGTGSGILPISFKKNAEHAFVSACDISSKALIIAAENAQLNHVEIQFIEADVLDIACFSEKIGKSFEIIVSNPPYIKQSEKDSMATNVLNHEPHEALFVEGDDPTIFYKRIIDYSKMALNPSGKLYFELNPLTAEDVLNYAGRSEIFETVNLMKDMSGSLRFLKAVKTKA